MMSELPQTMKCGGCDTQLPTGDAAAFQSHLDTDHPSALVRGLLRSGFVQTRHGQPWTLPGIYPAP